MDEDEVQIKAAVLRHMAHRYRAYAAVFDTAAACVKATASAHQFAEAFRRSEAREVAEHPDLAELNVQLDGFYGTE